MRATLDGQVIEPRLVGLDDLAFDRGHHGSRRVTLSLDAADLRAVGGALRSYVEEARADEPGFFDDNLMNDVSVPPSSDFLVQEPDLIATYLTEPFWARETVIAMLRAAGRGHHPQPTACSIVRFVGTSSAPGTFDVHFEAV